MHGFPRGCGDLVDLNDGLFGLSVLQVGHGGDLGLHGGLQDLLLNFNIQEAYYTTYE